MIHVLKCLKRSHTKEGLLDHDCVISKEKTRLKGLLGSEMGTLRVAGGVISSP